MIANVKVWQFFIVFKLNSIPLFTSPVFYKRLLNMRGSFSEATSKVLPHVVMFYIAGTQLTDYEIFCLFFRFAPLIQTPRFLPRIKS